MLNKDGQIEVSKVKDYMYSSIQSCRQSQKIDVVVL